MNYSVEDIITDFVCTKCIRELNLTPLLKTGGDYVCKCDVCDSNYKCCFILERSLPIWDKTCYNDYLRKMYPNNKHFYFNKLTFIYQQKMRKDGIEFEMGVTLFVICNKIRDEGIDIPTDVIKLIYGIAKRVKKFYWEGRRF